MEPPGLLMAEIRLSTWDVKTLQIMGEATYQLVSRIPSSNRIIPVFFSGSETHLVVTVELIRLHSLESKFE